MRITEYKLVKEGFIDFDKIINELIKDGWIPFGDPHFTENHAYQVMVKVEQNNLGIPVIR